MLVSETNISIKKKLLHTCVRIGMRDIYLTPQVVVGSVAAACQPMWHLLRERDEIGMTCLCWLFINYNIKYSQPRFYSYVLSYEFCLMLLAHA